MCSEILRRECIDSRAKDDRIFSGHIQSLPEYLQLLLGFLIAERAAIQSSLQRIQVRIEASNLLSNFFLVCFDKR